MLGKVQINNLNLIQGPLPSIENYFLYVGQGQAVPPSGENDEGAAHSAVNAGQLLSVNNDTLLDDILGIQATNLKIQLYHARLNAGQNFNACVLPLAPSATPMDAALEAIDFAMEHTSVEAIVVTDPLTKVDEVEALQAKAESIMGKYMRPLFIMGRAANFEPSTESFSDYQIKISPLTKNVAADQVLITPTFWGHEQGTLAGRLCNRSVTVADSPMRVPTGPLLGSWATRPVDVSGRVLDMSVLDALDKIRFSVPQWYPDYPGTYWADGNVLDVPGGDYQVIENVRVVQKAMRRVYPLAVARIADRRINQTPASIAAAQSYFMRPLREMSKSRKILGLVFPGEIEPPKDGDITLHWITKYELEIYMAVRPYNCPKSITCNLLLDLANYG